MVKFSGSLQNPMNHDVLAKTVLEMERLGFDSVWFEDHLIISLGSTYMKAHKVIPLSVMAPPVLESLTTLSWLAGQTRKIRLGTLVLCA
ncbi:MAG: LLM class flavin-dependent oxidoreductase, partial [Candidatus Bathyarchaeia archaeon]